MHRDLDHEADGVRECEPWDRVVADAAPCDHIVQLYRDQDFLSRAVCRFAGAGFANGEGIILVSTLTHWNAFRPRLEAEGVDVQAAQERGQLMVVDAEELLPRFMRDGMPDSAVFPGVFEEVVGQARAGGSYPKVRVWGEMVDVLWERGDVAASMNLEDLFDQLAKKVDISIFCSFLMRSEEHTSELQSQSNLVCRLLLEKKKSRCMTTALLPRHQTLSRTAPLKLELTRFSSAPRNACTTPGTTPSCSTPRDMRRQQELVRGGSMSCISLGRVAASSAS